MSAERAILNIMKMQKLAKDMINSKESVLTVIGLTLTLMLGAAAAFNLLLLSEGASILGWASLLACVSAYNFMFLLMIGDTKNWNPETQIQ